MRPGVIAVADTVLLALLQQDVVELFDVFHRFAWLNRIRSLVSCEAV